MFRRISSIFSTKLTSLSFNFKTGSLSLTYKSLSGAKELNFKFYLILSNNFTYSPGVCDCWTMQVWIISKPYHIEFTYIPFNLELHFSVYSLLVIFLVILDFFDLIILITFSYCFCLFVLIYFSLHFGFG